MPGSPALPVYLPCANQKYQHCTVSNGFRVSDHSTDLTNSSRRPPARQPVCFPWAPGHDFLSLSLASSTLHPALVFHGPLPPTCGISYCRFPSSSPLALEGSDGAAFLWAAVSTKEWTLTQHWERERCSKDTTSPWRWPGQSRVQYKLTWWINTIGTWFINYTPSKDRPSTEMRFIVHCIT